MSVVSGAAKKNAPDKHSSSLLWFLGHGGWVGFKDLKLWVFTVAWHEKQLQRDVGDKTTTF